ncbi:MAG TPA: methionine--tRNA ligase [Kofleriaceae bacterium]|nr:methionine--tRNA ligase [Kofleriaceae bacterium]
MTTSYITTAIPFVNARPHLGFAYELVLADILARHRRRRGHDVRFLTGTDDNSLKNVVAAEREGLTTRALVDRNASAFQTLGPTLRIEADDFIRTSTDVRHRPAVEHLWRACAARGDLYRRAWHGRYCPGCEAFVEDDVVVCAEHGVVPEPVSEENWFFRLSRYREVVRDAIVSGRLAIVPEAARAETLAFLDGEVRDLSVSRDATRSRGWGIPVPDDPTQVIYVWFDALVNYVSALGLAGDDTLLQRYWRDSERVHVIGKGISRFHAVYWPAFLLSAGLPLPDRIFVHGYLTVDGEKISKSRRTVEVGPVLDDCGADALRWYFARWCPPHTDADVSIDAICAAYDRDLVDRLGNLVQRSTTLAAKLTEGRVPEPCGTPAARELEARANELPARIDAALDAFAPHEAASAAIELLDAANRYLEAAAPWRVARTNPHAAATALYAPLVAARVAAAELAPFVPDVAAVLAARLGDLQPGASLIAGPPPLPRKRPRSAAPTKEQGS